MANWSFKIPYPASLRAKILNDYSDDNEDKDYINWNTYNLYDFWISLSFFMMASGEVPTSSATYQFWKDNRELHAPRKRL